MFGKSRRRVVLVILAGAALLLVPGPSINPHESRRVDLGPLVHTLGVFSFGPSDDADAARMLGVSYAVTGQAVETIAGGVGRGAAPLLVVDRGPQLLLYHARCPAGVDSCRPLTPADREQLYEQVRERVRLTRDNPNVIGYYVLDDYFGDMKAELRAIHAEIRAQSDKPVVCGIQMGLDVRRASGPAPEDLATVQTRSVSNYSPEWCDVAMVYGYAPATDPLVPTVTDWAMSRVLPALLRALRASGFDPRSNLLIGMPMAFSYQPRTDGGRNQYRLGPTIPQLSSQIQAYCAMGAQGVVAYSWKDSAQGIIRNLSNDPDLRRGVRAGVTACRSGPWRRAPSLTASSADSIRDPSAVGTQAVPGQNP